MKSSSGCAPLNALFDKRIDPALMPLIVEDEGCCGLEAVTNMGLHEMVDALSVAAYLTDPEGMLVHYNRAATALWGYEPAPGTARWCGSWRLFWPDGRPMSHDASPVAVALKERRVTPGVEVIAERTDGKRVAFLTYPTLLWNQDGTLGGSLTLLADISSHNRDQVADQLLAAIVESSHDAIVGKDLNGIIASWNAGAERLFGYSADEAIGRHISLVIPPDRAEEETRIIGLIRRGQRVETYETVRRRKDGSLVDVALTVSPVRNAEGHIIGASKIARDVTLQRRAAEHQKILVGEIKHRIKNSLATVQAIARQTLTSVPPGEMAAFVGRLQALAGAHDVLTAENWNRASLQEIVARAIDVFDDIEDDRFVVEGRDNVWLDADRAARLAMVLHELGTNAIKYGALSNDAGQVAIAWEIRTVDSGRRLHLSWKECGGPPVTKPERAGFGSTLIERTFRTDTSTVEIDYDRDGVRATFEIAL